MTTLSIGDADSRSGFDMLHVLCKLRTSSDIAAEAVTTTAALETRQRGPFEVTHKPLSVARAQD